MDATTTSAALSDDPRINAALAPVAGARATGEDLRYDAALEPVTAEIAKLQSLTAGPVDWRIVQSVGLDLLTSRAKDLNLACFVARALLDQEGPNGLATGLAIVVGLMDRYGADLYPARPKAKSGALRWLAENLVAVLDGPAEGSPAPALVRVREAIFSLERLAEGQLGDHAPALGDLRRLVVQQAAAVEAQLPAATANPASVAPGAAEPGAAEPSPTEEARPASEAAAVEPAEASVRPPAASPTNSEAMAAPSASVRADSVTAAPDTVPSGEAPTVAVMPPPVAIVAPTVPPADRDDLAGSLRALREPLRELAAHCRDTSVGDPLGYHLSRTAAWLHVVDAPRVEDGRTRLQPPDAGTVRRIEQLMAKAPEEAVVLAERTFASAVYWLDVHRLVHECLTGLGHARAARTVEAALRGFVGRLPEVVDLAFAEGTPFADEATRAWLHAGTGPAAPGSTTGHDGAPWLDAARAALELRVDKGLNAALALFGEGIRRSGGRDRFCWALEQARFCVAAGRPDLAQAQLLALDDEAVERRLDVWEPRLAVDVARELLLCRNGIGAGEGEGAQITARQGRWQAWVAMFDASALLSS